MKNIKKGIYKIMHQDFEKIIKKQQTDKVNKEINFNTKMDFDNNFFRNLDKNKNYIKKINESIQNTKK